MDRQAALTEFFEQFSLAYSSLNVDAVTSTFSMPFMTNVNGDITHWSEFDPLYQTTKTLFDWYYQQGFRSAHYEIVDQVFVGSDHATVELRWHVAREDQHYWIHYTGYQLRWIEEQWRICGIMQISTPEKSSFMPINESEEAWSPLALAEAALGDEIQRPQKAPV
ncbi:hypothetical protein NT239_08225 [Chitinibacter sp. SCUT-21]|uniref:hypothetical protein n=1 Tax=Chitinibacter sp. SCUT-21 TaxID=2970891 RepID=UPI0035A70E49